MVLDGTAENTFVIPSEAMFAESRDLVIATA